MKIFVHVVIFVLIWRWPCSNALSCTDGNCSQIKEHHATHHCNHRESYDHANEIDRIKRAFGITNITDSGGIEKKLHVVNKREDSKFHSEGQVSETPTEHYNSSPKVFNISGSQNTIAGSLTDDIAPSSTSFSESQKIPTDKRHTRDAPKNKTTQFRNLLRIERGNSFNSSNTQKATEATQNHTNVKRQNTERETVGLAQNTTIFKRQITVKNDSQTIENTTASERHTSDDITVDKQQSQENFKKQFSDTKNCTEETQQTDKTIKVRRRAFYQPQNNTQEAQNTTSVKNHTLQHHQNDTQKAQNTTRIERQTSLHRQNHTQKIQNKTKVSKQIPLHHQNHTNKAQNITRIARQISLDQQNLTHKAQNTTRIERQISLHRQNHTQKAQNKTKVSKQISLHPQNHTNKAQNKTRIGRQISLDQQNLTQKAQNTTRIERQISLDQQNHTQKAQNTTRVARQISLHRENHTQKAQNTTRVKREMPNYQQNEPQEAENKTIVKGATFSFKNTTEEAEKLIKVKRDSSNCTNSSDEARNSTNFKSHLFNSKSDTLGAQDTITVKRQTADNKNDTTEENQTTKVNNGTGVAQYNAMVKRETINSKNNSEESRNITKTTNEGTAEPKLKSASIQKRDSDSINETQHKNHKIFRRENQNMQNITSESSLNHAEKDCDEEKNGTIFKRQASEDSEAHITKEYSKHHHDGKVEKNASSDSNFTRVIKQVDKSQNNISSDFKSPSEIAEKSYRAILEAETNETKEDSKNIKKRSVDCNDDSDHIEDAKKESSILINRPDYDTHIDPITIIRTTTFGDHSETYSPNPQNVSLLQESIKFPSNERKARYAGGEHTYIERRASEAGKNDSRNITILENQRNSSRQRRSFSMENGSQIMSSDDNLILSKKNQENVENWTIYGVPIKYRSRPLVISVSGSTQKDNVGKFYEISNVEKNGLEQKGTDDIEDNLVEKHINLFDLKGVGSGSFRHGFDASEFKEELGQRQEDANMDKSTEKTEHVKCTCAMYRSDPAYPDPIFAETILEIPVGKNEMEKQLMCNKNCSEILKIHLKIKQYVCVNVKSVKGNLRASSPAEQLDAPETSQIIFCERLLIETNEPSVLFILSWLHLLFLDVMVCLSGIGIISMYLILFVGGRKRDSGPVYTPAGFASK